ncbi:MAG: M15 family metallopeptidase [Nocardioides sp.]
MALAAAMLLAACGAAVDPRNEPDGPPSTSSGAPTPSSSEEPSLDPDLAVAPPGPRTDSVVPADILLSAKDTLGPTVLRAVRKLRGVEAFTTLSLANVSLENKVYTVAAVDPATYRRFTDASSADLQEQWDRVAAGELSIDSKLRRTLPVSAAGYLGLDLGEETRQLHVGAWAPQVDQIDLVVNERIGEAMGITSGNALLISTGPTAPDELRAPLKEIIGPSTSVQNLDAVARFGLDPDAFQTAVLVGSFADAVGVFNYTPIGGGRIAPDPAWVSAHIATETVPILGTVTCNTAIFPQLRAALAEVVQQGLANEINPGQYAGCYYPRFIAGSTTLSNHSFGLALDLNVPGNLRGTVGEMDRGVVAIFKRWGFAWGGDWRYTDPMHFELDRIVRPG